MGRLADKSILVLIPKDYYDERELEPVLAKFRAEEPRFLKVASSKFKEAVGMKNGRHLPDVLIVDAVEGVTGDSYVTDGSGTRQILAVFQAVVVMGGKGARKNLWDDKIVRLLITDRYRSGAVVAGIGTGVVCLAKAGLIETMEVAYEENKHTTPEIEKANAILSEDSLTVEERIITAKGWEVAEEFAEAVIEAVQDVSIKK